MSPKLLIIGAGREQLPAFQIARRLGLTILATDRDPAAPGRTLADQFVQVSTDDLTANLAVARQHQIQGVMTLCLESSVPVVAAIATRLGLPGISEQTAFLATNKNAMRAALAQAGVAQPPFRPVVKLADAQAFLADQGLPLVVKPSDGSGQKATALLYEADQLAAWVAKAQAHARDGQAIVEGFIPGREINVTVVVHRGRIQVTSLSDRVTAALPHFGIALRHVAPPDLDPSGRTQVEQLAAVAVRAIGMDEGIAYPQILWDGTQAWLVEIAARIPGGFMADVARYVSGIDLVEVAILQALGRPFELADLARQEPKPGFVVDFITRLDVPGAVQRVSQIQGLDAAQNSPGVERVFLGLKPGDPIPALTHSGARFGAIFASGADRHQALTRAAAAKALIQID